MMLLLVFCGIAKNTNIYMAYMPYVIGHLEKKTLKTSIVVQRAKWEKFVESHMNQQLPWSSKQPHKKVSRVSHKRSGSLPMFMQYIFLLDPELKKFLNFGSGCSETCNICVICKKSSNVIFGHLKMGILCNFCQKCTNSGGQKLYFRTSTTTISGTRLTSSILIFLTTPRTSPTTAYWGLNYSAFYQIVFFRRLPGVHTHLLCQLILLKRRGF